MWIGIRKALKYGFHTAIQRLVLDAVHRET